MTPMNEGAGLVSNDAVDDGDTGFLDMALGIAQNLRMLFFIPILAGLVAMGSTYLITPTFSARTVILPPQQQQSAASMAIQSLGALASVAGVAAGVRNPADQYIALMQSQSVEDRLIDAFKLLDVYKTATKTEARRALEANTRIGAGKKDGLITVEVDDLDPTRAAALANAYVAELEQLTKRLAVTEAQVRRQFFEKQLLSTKDRFSAAQRALQGAGINEGALRAEPKAAAEAYARLRAEVTAAEVRWLALRGSLTDAAPELQQAQATLQALRGQLSKAESENKPAADGEYINRYRDFKYQETLYELFVRQFELAKLDESREGAVIQVVDQATPPELKSRPKRGAIAIVTTLVTGFVLLAWIAIAASASRVRADSAGAAKLNALGAALRRAFWR